MSQCKSFVSETELAERRIRRQQEWEKVRKPEDPLDAPEEEYDPRSLYERLKEQKDQKQAEYEEAHRLKNMIRGLDDDEVEFLDLVDRTKGEIEAQRWKEETKEIQEFRKAVATLAEKNAEQRLLELKKEVKVHLTSSQGVKKSQSSLLASAVKRKNCDPVDSPEKKGKLDVKDSSMDKNSTALKECTNYLVETETCDNLVTDTELNGTVNNDETTNERESQVCSLPGLGVYSDSSDSDTSASDIEDGEEFDLVGRRKIPKRAYDALMKYLGQKKLKQQLQHHHWS